MKSNINKTSAKFCEHLLYFQQFMWIFVSSRISDYRHLKMTSRKLLFSENGVWQKKIINYKI